jgi:hypothetical protein
MRKNSAFVKILGMAALVLALAGTVFAGQVESGKSGVGTIITASKFGAFVIRAGAQAPGARAEVGMQLFEGDQVVTKELGKLDLLLDDGSMIRLKENTDLVLKDKKPGKQKTRLQVLLGRIWAKVTKQENLLEIETPSAVAAIKGTSLELTVLSNGDSTLLVWDGLVKFYNDLGEVMVKAAQESRTQHGQQPGGAVDVDLNKLDQWWKSSVGLPSTQTLKTTVKDKDGKEYQLNLKYDKK